MSSELDPLQLAWPAEEDAASDSLEANHDYTDLRGLDWPEVERILGIERKVVARLLAAEDAEAEWAAICDELNGSAEHVADMLDGALYGLEPSAAAAVLALSALGAIPYWSDGGALHKRAAEVARPEARFFALPAHVGALVAAATEANVSITLDAGRCVVRANDPHGLMDFAEALLRAHQA